MSDSPDRLPPPEHDIPTVEQRLAFLESEVSELDRRMEALKNSLKTHLEGPRPGIRNCPHCGRRLNVASGVACTFCGKKS